VKSLFRRFIGWLRGKRSGPRSFYREPHAESPNAISNPVAVDCKVCTVVWTLDEAESAWRAGRTNYNLGETFRRFAKSLESMAGSFLVDGDAARVVVCVDEAVKQRILSVPFGDETGASDISKAQQAIDKEWLEGQKWLERQKCLERQEWAKFSPAPKPIEGRICSVCGGKLVVEILNYFWDRGTDVCSAADTKRF
jgi:hypothetical protein